MRFKLDENLPLAVARYLSDAGHDAVMVLEQQMGGAPDALVIGRCDEEERILLTLDLDFADIRAYVPSEHAGIIVLRLPRADIASVLGALQHAAELFVRESPSRSLWIVEPERVRIRS